LEDLFVLYAELTALDVEAVEGHDDCVSVSCLAEIGKCQAAESTLLVKVVVEGVRGRDRQGCLQKG
jgi:hypothetical protein